LVVKISHYIDDVVKPALNWLAKCWQLHGGNNKEIFKTAINRLPFFVIKRMWLRCIHSMAVQARN